MTTTLVLDKIRCVRPSEKGGDEFYCFVHKYNAEGGLQNELRIPAGGVWRLKAGQILEVQAPLMVFKQTEASNVGLIFMEEDVPAVSRRLAGFIRKLTPSSLPDPIDDCLGELFVIYDGKESIKWSEGLNVVHEEDQADAEVFRLSEKGVFDYELTFKFA